MSEFVSSNVFGNLLVGVLAAVAVGLLGFFSRDSIRGLRARRKEQQLRHRQRQEFWGYE